MDFSFGFGGGSSKNSFSGTDNYDKTGTTQQSTTTNQTSTPTNPDWVSTGAQGIWGGAQTLGSFDPHSYVAGPDALQTQAGQGAGALGVNPAYQSAIDKAHVIMEGGAPLTSAVTAAPYISSYLNSYLPNVVDATKADMAHAADQTRSQQALDLARSGAFGGSGSALAIGETEGQLSRALGTTLGNLRYQGFDTAAQNAQQDAARQQSTNDYNATAHNNEQNRRLAAGQEMANIADQQHQTQLQNIGAQGTTGGALQTIAQNQAQAPLALQSWQQQLLSGLPLQLFNGQTQTGTQDMVGVQNETGTENQSGTSKGSNNSFKFGFG